MVTSYLRDLGSIRLLVQFGLRHGLTEQQLLSHSGLCREQLGDSLAEIEPTQEIAVIENLVTLLGDEPLLGMRVGWEYSLTVYGQWSFALLCSSTVEEALEQALRFLPLTYAFCSITVRRLNGQMAVLFADPIVPKRIKPFVIQRDMAAAAKLIKTLLGDERKIERFMYAGEKPHAPALSLPKDWDLEMEFGSALNALIFDATYLAAPMPLANPLTAAACERYCSEMIERRSMKQDTAATVRMYLHAYRDDGMLDLPTLAEKLHMSDRALRRHLQEEGSSFREILGEVRRQLAADMLSSGNHSMAHIAATLGYSDQSSFSQAYKRWHGVAPSAVRYKRE